MKREMGTFLDLRDESDEVTCYNSGFGHKQSTAKTMQKDYSKGALDSFNLLSGRV